MTSDRNNVTLFESCWLFVQVFMKDQKNETHFGIILKFWEKH